MRIGIDAMTLSGRDTGVGTWTRGLIGALARADCGHELVVYHGRDAGRPGPGAPRVRYVRVPLPNRVRPLRILWEQTLLPRRLRRDGVDVLHCPAYVRPLAAGVPTVLTLHDLFALTHPRLCTRLNRLHFRLMLPPSIARADVIHCTSRWTESILARLFPSAAGKAEVIHPAPDDIFFEPGDPEAPRRLLRRLGLGEPPFLFVGNVEPKKNVPVILDALASLAGEAGAGPKLLMVGGEGRRGPRLARRIRRLGLQDRVVRAGYVERAALPAFYRAALALVFPSSAEGFGLPPLEAMACGTPVICTAAGGLAESAGDAALTVPPGDPAELARAMRRTRGSPELREGLRQAGLQRAQAFRWADATARFVRLYEKAAGRPGELDA